MMYLITLCKAAADTQEVQLVEVCIEGESGSSAMQRVRQLHPGRGDVLCAWPVPGVRHEGVRDAPER